MCTGVYSIYVSPLAIAAASISTSSAILAAALASALSEADMNQLRAAIEPRFPVRDFSPEWMRDTALS